MKTKRNIFLVISLFCFIVKSHSLTQGDMIINRQADSLQPKTKEIYVSLNGDDLTGFGSADRSYKTIQKAVDNAQNGDVIIVLPGRYGGIGNINIRPSGKEIEIRSINPFDSSCLNSTIIDAAGQGLIARFTDDESANTIINGFSLVCGDKTIPINKGIPGFFEFSKDADPTIKNVRISGELTNSINRFVFINQSSISDNSNNPFIHPVATTDYFGSGDVNKDGVIDFSDYEVLIKIIGGQLSPNARSDVDGNGQITANDANLLLSSLTNSTPLPSSWNYLSTTPQRNDWINKMVENDKTDDNLYDYYYYQCLNYAQEFYFHFNHYLSDTYFGLFPLNAVYNGGQSIYNLPMYYVTVSSQDFGHAINAILIGNNPLNFYDWRFIEPQLDNAVVPGYWDMPYNTDVNIWTLQNPTAESRAEHIILSFHVDLSSVTLTGQDSNLVLVRPLPSAVTAENCNYQWYPNILVSDTAYILFDQTRDDMTRKTDIHIKNAETWDDKPITLFDETSFLLDYVQESDSIIHVLFTSRLTKKPGVYYGKYNLLQNVFFDTARISGPDPRIVPSGKLIIAGNQIYAFWFLNNISSMYMPSPGGIYWNHKSHNTDWASEALIYPVANPVFSLDFNGQSIFPYFMDGVSLNNGDVFVVAQSVNEGSDNYSDIIFMHYNGMNWTADSLNFPIANINYTVRYLDLTCDLHNNLHLVFSNPWNWATNALPSIYYTFSSDNGNNWSPVSQIDSSQIISNYSIFSSPRLISEDEKLFLTYINMDNPSKIIWRKYEQNEWHSINAITLPDSNYAWFPQIASLPSNRLLLVWSNSFNGRIELKKKIIDCSLPSPVKPAGPDSLFVNSPPTQYFTRSIQGADYYDWILTPDNAGALSTNDTLSTVTWNNNFFGQACLKVKAVNGCGESGFSDTLSINIFDCPLPVPAGTISGDTTICTGQNAVPYSIPEIVNATSYTWTLPAGATGTSSTNNIVVDYGASSVSGEISVYGINSCGDGIASSLSVSVTPSPEIPEISVNNFVLHSNAATGNQWHNQTGLIPGATHQNYTVISNGEYYDIVTIDGCSSDTSDRIKISNVGVERIENNKFIKIYPNPVSNELVIKSEGNNESIKFEILNLIGHVVLTGKLTDKSRINTNDFPSGIYLIKFEDGEIIEFNKIVKE